MTTLIDRYVFTVLRRVPEQQRSDIERELRTSIDDAVDARLDSGETGDAAVEQALLELGDPERLADGYAGRPRHLIGPDFYPAWRRTVITLLSTVLPTVVTIATVISVLDRPTFGEVVGTIVGTTLTVGGHILFWVTLTFAILDRSGAVGTDLRRKPWTPADLPRYEAGHLTPAAVAGAVVWPVLLIAALVLQQFTFTEVPVLDPANWSFWWPYLIVVLVLETLYPVWLLRRGAWTHTATAVNAVLAVLFAAPVVWLATTERFFNPAWIATLNWGDIDPQAWLTGVVILTTVITTIWDITDVALRAERARRGLATPVPGTDRAYTSPLS